MINIDSMELALNLLWAAIGALAFALFAMRVASTSDPRIRRRLCRAGSLAVICIVVMLFPIISATDDLQAGTAMVEENVVRRGKVLTAQGYPHEPGKASSHPALIPPPIALPQHTDVAQPLEASPVVSVARRGALRTNPRSPPFSGA